MMDSVNPLGTDGFEFVEYTAADEQGIASLKHLFTSLALPKLLNTVLKKLGCIVRVTSTLLSTHSLVAKLKRLLNSMALRYAGWRFA